MAKTSRTLFFVVFLASFYGCAGTIPSANFKKPLNETYRLCAYDEATVRLAPADNVTLNDISRQRLQNCIKDAINLKKNEIPCRSSEKRSFILDSRITRYDEGSAFARFMLAGLGQIHIDGDFDLLLLSQKDSSNESVAQFSLSKTFAWGGIYGGTTRIEDIEITFAGGVADAIIVPVQKAEGTTSTQEKTK